MLKVKLSSLPKQQKFVRNDLTKAFGEGMNKRYGKSNKKTTGKSNFSENA